MREKGDVLEDFVEDNWPENISRTPNSGAKYGDNDLITPTFSIECKRRLVTATAGFNKQEIKQCIAKAHKRHKEPCWVTECQSGKFVMLTFDDFCNLLYEARNGKEEDKEEDQKRTT